MTAFSAHQGDNQEFSIVGVVGTLGTADVKGTAQVLPIGVDPTTGAQYVNVISGSINVGTVSVDQNISAGTLNTLGTINTIGTLPAITIGTVPGIGTITNIGSISNIGTMPSISANPANGTLNTLGTVGVINNIVTGTLAALPNINIATGSLVGTMTVGSVPGIGTLSNVGSVNTVTTVANLTAGTVSINTKQVGSAILTTQTLGTTSVAVWGTLIAPVGAGTYIYLSGLSIVVNTGTVDTAMTTNIAGSTGAGVLARGAFPAGGGIMRDFTYPVQIGTNGTLAYWFGGAGTVSLTANYWVGT